jgi:uncharacterized protein
MLFYFILLGLTIFSLIIAYKMFIEPYQLMISEKDIISDNIQEDIEGFTILHLADFHLEKNKGKHLINFFDQLEKRKFDAIVLTGDYIENTTGFDNLEKILDKMNDLKPKYGIFACLGNHDYFHFSRKDFVLVRYVVEEQNNIKQLKDILEKNGVEILIDNNQVIKTQKGSINFVGIDEYVSGRFSVPVAMDNVDKKGFTVLISHAPDIVFHLAPFKVDLVLSGHTHGGQIKLPFIGTIIKRTKLTRKQASGLFKYKGTYVHVTQGLGSSPKAMIRFLCSPEMAILTLKRKRTLTNVDRIIDRSQKRD